MGALKPHKKRIVGRPFPPGNNANPLGRPRVGTSVAEIFRSHAEAVDPEDPDKRKRVLVLADKLYLAGRDGAIPAAKLYIERGYGAATPEPPPDPDDGDESAEYIRWLRKDGNQKHKEAFFEWLNSKAGGNGYDKG